MLPPEYQQGSYIILSEFVGNLGHKEPFEINPSCFPLRALLRLEHYLEEGMKNEEPEKYEEMMEDLRLEERAELEKKFKEHGLPSLLDPPS